LIRRAALHDLLYVAHHMREWDRREIYASRWRDDPEELALDCWRHRETAWVAFPDGLDRPVAAVGAVERWPSVWSVWMFGTDDLSLAGLSLHRFVKRDMIPALRGSGARRADCMSLDGHTDAHAWLTRLGARRTTEPFLNWGRGGETFWQFYWEP
jgi:hypothetical protein